MVIFRGVNKAVLLTARLLLVMAVFSQMHAQAPPAIPSAYNQAAQVNYVRTWDATAPEQDPVALKTRLLKDVKQATQYFDGLGRPVQTVIKKGSLETLTGTNVDLVSPVLYDDYGREQLKYMPFASNTTGGNSSTNDGQFKLNPFAQQSFFYSDSYTYSPVKSQGETWYFGKTSFETSPLNRVAETYAAGNSWAGSSGNTNEIDRHAVKMKYWLNTAADAVRIWTVTNGALTDFGAYSSNGVYDPGLLYKMVTVDEKNNQVIEFKDKEGKVILKKVQIKPIVSDDGTGSGHVDWLCTYYIYDAVNNLRCVIQPSGIELISANNWQLLTANSGVLSDAGILAEQTFRYQYDQRNRMIMKKVPGAGPVYMVYDGRDRLVMTQDANLRAAGKWLYTKYDNSLNQPIQTGLIGGTAGDFSSHLSSAYSSSSYPVTAGADILTETYYDNYSFSGNPFGNSLSTADNSYLYVASTSYPYPQAITQNNGLKGMVTGTKTKILGTTSTYLYSIRFYDSKNRLIQIQNQNISGATDITTTQYNWAGQPLMTIVRQSKSGTNNQYHIVVTKSNYDDLGRLLDTKKLVYSNYNGAVISRDLDIIASNQYDALGQLKNKKLAPAYTNNGTTAPLQELKFDYNIRGWLLGTNRDYLTTTGQSGTTKFGFELGYDKLGTSSGRSFTAAQFNGNISGITWKSDGDDVKRKYDYSYDVANRLLKADFEQDDANASWNNTTLNFNMQMGNGTDPTTAYDANGNIKAMYQTGWKATGTTTVDDLVYKYQNNSNKLSYVYDRAASTGTKLGDFQESTQNYNDNTAGTPIADYDYDDNGNLLSDKNKNISGIVYNYLNLPQTVTVTGKGTISYTYDAGGNKLQKTTVETAPVSKTTTTTYIAGSVYENDVIQFIAHEEGRVRPLYNNTAAPTTVTGYASDYFLKDHLGNVRMMLTDEIKENQYPAATLETALLPSEQGIYKIPVDGATRVNKSTVAGYPSDNATNPNDFIHKLSGNGTKLGTSILLKVMAGDQFSIRASSWYNKNGASPETPVTTILTDLLTIFSTGINGIAGAHGGITDLETQNAISPGITSFFSKQDDNASAGKPRAFLNWVLFDEQLKYVASNSGVDPVGGDNTSTVYPHVILDKPVDKSGYLYVFVSNETPNINVYFDNLQVTHKRGSLLEECHYYPFGLAIAGISSKSLAFGGAENKYKYNSKEEQRKEFSDGSGLDWMDYGARMYTSQLGRYFSQDRLSEKFNSFTPYSYVNNDPIHFTDTNGDSINISKLIFNSDGTLNKDGLYALVNIVGDLQETTGLNLSVTGSGMLISNGANENASGFSQGAREYLEAIIGDDKHNIKVNRSEIGNQSERIGEDIFINTKQIDNNIFSMEKAGLGRLTYGYGFSFLHESLHTVSGTEYYFKGARETLKDPNLFYSKRNQAGDVEDIVNLYRQQMNIAQRLDYFTWTTLQGETQNWQSTSGNIITILKQTMPESEREKLRVGVHSLHPSIPAN